VSDGDSDATLDSDGDTDPENDPTETLITQTPILEVTKTYRIVEKSVQFNTFGEYTGNSLENWSMNPNAAGLNDGFISTRSISKEGEYFEFFTRGDRTFVFGLVNANDFSIDEVKNYFDNSNSLGDSEPQDKFNYAGGYYDRQNGKRIWPSFDHFYLDPQGSSASFTKNKLNRYTLGSSYEMVRSVSRVRIGFSDVGKPTISVYSKYPTNSGRGHTDQDQGYVYPHPPTYGIWGQTPTYEYPSIDFVEQWNTNESFDDNAEYHFIMRVYDNDENEITQI
jgi:hypothetical protein